MTTELTVKRKDLPTQEKVPHEEEVNELTNTDNSQQSKLKFDPLTFTFRLVFIMVLIVMLCALVSTTDRIGQFDFFDHNYADNRKLIPLIPNTMDVLSNLPFLVIGIFGMLVTWKVSNERIEYAHERINYLIFFISSILIFFGSGYYYLSPTTPRLYWDRLPRALAFTSLFYILVTEKIDTRSGRSFIGPLIVFGFITIVYWIFKEMNYRGDLYILLQFTMNLVSPFIIYFFGSRYSHHQYYYYCYAFHLIAKFCEILDKPIYKWTLHNISGNSLKHLFSSFAALFVAIMLPMRSIKVKVE